MNAIKARSGAWAAGIMAGALIIILLLLYLALGLDPLLPSPYNSYTLQALAWREGRTWLQADVDYLELAVYGGRYFVSFPPVPSLPIFLLSFIFGLGVPDGLLVKLYSLIAYLAICRLLRRNGWRPWPAAVTAFLLCAASSMLPLLLTGAVWYQAQVMAFMFTCLAVLYMQSRRPTLGLLWYALAVGCRPFNALYGPILIAHYLLSGDKAVPFWKRLRSLLPGLLIGLAIAALYAWYNCIRFGDPFEFGHNYLPEFSWQGGTQFSLAHIGRNLGIYLWGLPFIRTAGGFEVSYAGFSLFLANPILLLLLVWGIRDAQKSSTCASKLLVLLFMMLQLMLLLCHRTFGGFQYGARYAVDLIPYAALYLSLDAPEKRFTKPFLVIMALGLLMSLWGSLTIVLPH
ncbi:MAG: hypothetical protein AB9880_04265 [Christensenellales bacterium]